MVSTDSNEKLQLMLYIQSDWDSLINEPGSSFWVSCKFKDEPSIEGKITTVRTTEQGIDAVSNNGFILQYTSKHCLEIQHEKSSLRWIFIAANQIFREIHSSSIVSLCAASTGLGVSCCTEDKLLIWDARKGQKRLELEGHVGDVYKCRFFPSEKVILSCGADMRLRIWCAFTGACPVTLVGHKMAVTDFAIVERGRNVISVSKDGTAKLWCCADGSCLSDLFKWSSDINCCLLAKAPESLQLTKNTSVKHSPLEIGTEGKILMVGCEDGTAHLIDVQNRKVISTLKHDSAVNSIAFLSPSNFLIGCQNGTIYLYNISVSTSKPAKVWSESNSAVLSILNLRDKGFFTSRADGAVLYRPLVDCGKYLILTGPNFDPVYDMSCDGKFVYTCSRDKSIRKYNVDPILMSFF